MTRSADVLLAELPRGEFGITAQHLADRTGMPIRQVVADLNELRALRLAERRVGNPEVPAHADKSTARWRRSA